MVGSALTLWVAGITAALFAALLFFAGLSLAYAGTSALTFVTNHTELYAALDVAEKGTIGSVAISEKYFQEGTSRIQKNQIRGLISRTFELGGGRMVYLYGLPFDETLARELLDAGLMICRPAYALGRTNDHGNSIRCMVSRGNESEEEMRAGLRASDTSR